MADSSAVNCTGEFLARFGGKAFSTFDAFSKELQAFEESTGTQYMMKRTCLFNEGTLGREFLVYRYMHFACVRHIRPAKKMGQRAGGTKCLAYFSVGTRRHKLFVKQYDMHHNHPLNMEPIVEDLPSPVVNQKLEDTLNANALSQVTVRDCTEEFFKIFKTMKFASFNELQQKMDEFQMVTGSRYVKTNTRRLPEGSPGSETLVYSHLVYICYRYGTNVSEANNRRIQRTAKIGCLAKIYFYSQDNFLHIRRYDFRHNHDVRPDLVHFPPKRRRSRNTLQKESEQQLKPRENEDAQLQVKQLENQELNQQQRPSQRQNVAIDMFREIDDCMVDDEDDEDNDEQDLEMMPYDQMQQPTRSLPSHAQFEKDIRSVFPMHGFNGQSHPYFPRQSKQGMHPRALAVHPFSSFDLPNTVPRGLPHHHIQQMKDDVEDDNEEQADVEEMQEFDMLYQPDPNWAMMRSMRRYPKPLDAMLPRLGPHIQRLTELATCCGPVRFSTRVRELKALGDKWCRENEILMKRRSLI